jgi:hypothetical protein
MCLTLKSPPDDNAQIFPHFPSLQTQPPERVFSMGSLAVCTFEIKKHSIRVYINLENSQLGDKFLLRFLLCLAAPAAFSSSPAKFLCSLIKMRRID